MIVRKTGKKPTLREKKLIEAVGLKVENWLVQKKDNEYLYIIHRHSSNVRKLPYSLLERR